MAPLPTDPHTARARYLGADAALARAAALIPTHDEASRTLAGDIAWVAPPDLTGATPDDTTPALLVADVLGPEAPTHLPPHRAAEVTDRLAAAWHEGRDLVWRSALLAVALRVTAATAAAQAIEARNEDTATHLRDQAR